MSQLKKLAGETAIYGISSILARTLNFFLTPLYTGVFTLEEFGKMSYLYAFVAFLNIVYTYGLETAYFRFANKENADEHRVFSTAQSSIIVSSLFFSLIVIVFSPDIAKLVGFPGQKNIIIWFGLLLAVDAITAIPFAKLRFDKKPVYYASAKMINILLTIGLNLFFLVYCDNAFKAGGNAFVKAIYNPRFGVEYVFLSNLIANAALIIILWKVLAKARFAIDMETLKPMLKYGYPILLMGLAGMTNEMFSRILLDYWLPSGFYKDKSNLAAIGVFAACFRLSIFMNLAIQAFRLAAEPFFFSRAKDKNSPELFASIMHWFIIACCFILLAVSINLDVLKFFLRNKSYWEGLFIIPILLLSYLFLGVYYNLSAWFKLSDKTYFGTYITIFGAVVTVLGNYLLIPVLGYFGSALATLCCYFLMAVACYYFGQKYYPIPYKVIWAIGYIAATVALAYMVMAVKIENLWLSFGFHSVVILLYLAAIYVLEKDKLKENLKVNS